MLPATVHADLLAHHLRFVGTRMNISNRRSPNLLVSSNRSSLPLPANISREIADTHRCYPSDLTDAEWGLVEPLIPPGKTGGGKRTVNMREVVNGLMYILSTGCQWRAERPAVEKLGL
jgi:hypothetical protein